jgi:NADPH-dependent glutamate synthase beta subunit-like oxidoreductase/NAD-dependent dihydropyrimidine dehydrogenase PreA subunit
MEHGVLLIGSDYPTLLTASILAGADVPVRLVTKHAILGEPALPARDGEKCAPRPPLMLELGIAAHHNISIHYTTRVTDAREIPGGLEIRLEKAPRYIDEELCSGCGQCAEACPVEIDGRKAIYFHGRLRVPTAYSIQKAGDPPCRGACPAGVNAQGYIALIRAGKYAEALELEREENPMPGVCGRVCHRPCESRCIRGKVDAPVSIRDLKRFIADQERMSRARKRPEKGKDAAACAHRIAIIGAGPSGLACAHYLDGLGYEVTIFEAGDSPGGMLSWAIPDFRLPRDIVCHDIDMMLSPSAVIATGKALGRDFSLDELKKQGFSAIFVGIGAQKGMELEIPGEKNRSRICNSLDFMRALSGIGTFDMGKEVLVIGGGNSAVDAARTALRKGARKVSLVYRRTRREMPAIPEEVDEAIREGIELLELTSPLSFVFDGDDLCGLQVVKNRLGDADTSGRARPVPIKGSEMVLPCDTLITALGQAVDLTSLKGMGLALTLAGTIIIDELSGITNIEGVFAGGDAVTGAATVIEAIAAGKRGARGIDALLRGRKIEPLKEMSGPDDARVRELTARAVEGKRNHPEILPLKERITTMDEVEHCFEEPVALKESLRCLNCGDCSICGQCERVCTDARAVLHGEEPSSITVGAQSLFLCGPDESERLRDVARKDGGTSLSLSKPGDWGAQASSGRIYDCSGSGVPLPGDLPAAVLQEFAFPLLGRMLREDEILKAFLLLSAAGYAMGSHRFPEHHREMPGDDAPKKAPERIGIFLCRCGGAVDGALKALSLSPGGIAEAMEIERLCSDDGLEAVNRQIAEKELDGALLGGCACCTHAEICEGCSYERVRAKRRFLESLSLSRENLEFCNIREQWAWVGGEPSALHALLETSLALLREGKAPPLEGFEREQRIVLLNLGESTLELATLLTASGFEVVACAEDLSADCAGKLRALPKCTLFVDHGAPRHVGWERGTFSLTLMARGKTQELRAGACVAKVFPESGSPFVKDAFEKNGGYFPGLFLVDDMDGRAASCMGLYPAFLSALIACFMRSEGESAGRGMLTLDRELCRRCMQCVEICPRSSMAPDQESPQGAPPRFQGDLCGNCGLCVMACATGCLKAVPPLANDYERILGALLGA